MTAESQPSASPTSVSSNFRQWAFRLGTLGFASAAVYHLTAMCVPAFARIAYSPTYPLSRHVFFVVIDGIFAWLFVRRPKWLMVPYIALTAQVINGHGVPAWLLWRQTGKIDWISLFVVSGMILGFFLLLTDSQHSQSRATTGH